MSLNPAILRQSFSRWFSNPGGVLSTAHAESKFAESYHKYAVGAQDVSGERAVNLGRARFQSELRFISSRTAEQFCRQIDKAFVAYWTGRVFAVGVVPPPAPPCPNVGGTGVFSSEVSSVVVEVTPGVLYAELFPVVSVSGGSAQGKAVQLAAKLDAATKRAVKVLITGWDTTPGPAGPLPITNTCTVF